MLRKTRFLVLLIAAGALFALPATGFADKGGVPHEGSKGKGKSGPKSNKGKGKTHRCARDAEGRLFG